MQHSWECTISEHRWKTPCLNADYWLTFLAFGKLLWLLMLPFCTQSEVLTRGAFQAMIIPISILKWCNPRKAESHIHLPAGMESKALKVGDGACVEVSGCCCGKWKFLFDFCRARRKRGNLCAISFSMSMVLIAASCFELSSIAHNC